MALSIVSQMRYADKCAIKSAVDHFRTAYRIPVSALLLYDSLIVPFAYWFFIKRHEPSGDDHLRMRQFFW